MSLVARFVVRRLQHQTTIDLDVRAGEVIGLIGPNGAGKTTTLQALAGLLPLTSGEIRLDDRVLSSPTIFVPPHQRRIGYVFQDNLLFPHLGVADNVAFGLRARGVNRRTAKQLAHDWLDRLGVADLADRRTSQLSGGQAQRVAIARALASDPAMLLLDEPTAALDAAGGMALRTQLRQHLSGFAGVSILVTHTALDAMVIADRVVVLDGGEIVQAGPPAEVAAHPRTDHVAALVGLNLVRGNAVNGILALPGGSSIVAAEPVNGAAFAAFSPASVSLYASRPAGSPRNVWRGTVTSLAPHGDVVRVQLDASIALLADVTPAALSTLNLQPGQQVWASVKATEVTVYPT
ncbi:MAG: ABC transporter ATP-binding protein [Nocardioidaceae bacterium]